MEARSSRPSLWKTRRPKAEGRNPKEIRNPKPESARADAALSLGFSGFDFLSDLGFRISVLKMIPLVGAVGSRTRCCIRWTSPLIERHIMIGRREDHRVNR